jgi:hypothetical protein
MTEEKYKSIIDRIRDKQPLMTNPQKLAADIMSSIQSEQRKKPRTRFFEILSWASSAAAIFLLVLFITEKSASAESPVQGDRKAPCYVSAMRLKNNYGTPDNIKSIIKFKSEQQKKRQTFYSELASRY